MNSEKACVAKEQRGHLDENLDRLGNATGRIAAVVSGLERALGYEPPQRGTSPENVLASVDCVVMSVIEVLDECTKHLNDLTENVRAATIKYRLLA